MAANSVDARIHLAWNQCRSARQDDVAPAVQAPAREDGAWGITVATVSGCRHAVVSASARNHGQQVVSDHDLRSVLRALRGDPALNFYCLVDSTENIDRLHDNGEPNGPAWY
jgi:D-serine deaminase-like pyridoxal phosphate-dependent protein